MIIKIDYRENDLYNKCLNNNNNNNIIIERNNLPIGDIIIEDNEKELLIIERKTLNDLAASIKDGRYKEQSFRLNQLSIPNHNIIYLIEGCFINYKKNISSITPSTKMPENTLLSAIITLNYYKGFSIYRTFNIDETAKYILQLANKLLKEKDKIPYYNLKLEKINEQTNTNINEEKNNNNNNDNNNNNNDNNEKYCDVIKRTKKNNITTNNIGEIMLIQIPNVSSNSAIAIMNKFKTIKNLIHELENNDKCLNDIKINNNGKERKLNKNCINSIYTFLLQNV